MLSVSEYLNVTYTALSGWGRIARVSQTVPLDPLDWIDGKILMNSSATRL